MYLRLKGTTFFPFPFWRFTVSVVTVFVLAAGLVVAAAVIVAIVVAPAAAATTSLAVESGPTELSDCLPSVIASPFDFDLSVL